MIEALYNTNFKIGDIFSVEVLSFKFEIEIVEGIVSEDEETKTVGNIRHTEQRIYVDGNQHQKRILVTILHELVHAMLEISGHIDLHNNEDLVDAVAFGFASLKVDWDRANGNQV